MSAVMVLVALSAVIGFVLGRSLSWPAIAASSLVLAILCAAFLQSAGFAAPSGIAIIVACLTVNQLAYLVGAALANHHLEEARNPCGRHEIGISFMAHSTTNQAKIAKTTLPTKIAGMKTHQLRADQGPAASDAWNGAAPRSHKNIIERGLPSACSIKRLINCSPCADHSPKICDGLYDGRYRDGEYEPSALEKAGSHSAAEDALMGHLPPQGDTGRADRPRRGATTAVGSST
jgi:hypothetical protein